MGKYTTFQKSFWSDDYVLSLTRDQKLVYAYLVTNDKTQQCGIYEIALSKVCLELAMTTEDFLYHLKKFVEDKKIYYSMETKEVCIINWMKHNGNTSWKTMESVKKQLQDIKNPVLMLLLYDPRKPLFDGHIRKKDESGRYVETPHIIENPWKEYFSTLSDSDLLEIRSPFMPEYLINKGHIRGMHGASAITITEQNNNRTITEQNNNTNMEPKAPHSQFNQPFQPYIPPDPLEPERDYTSEFELIREAWNNHTGNAERKTLYDFSEPRKMLDRIKHYTLEEITTAIENFSKTDESKTLNYSLPGFLDTGVPNYLKAENHKASNKLEEIDF